MITPEWIIFIENSLQKNHSADATSGDLNSHEVEFLTCEMNIRFKDSTAETFCFFSSRPGAGGYGKTKIEAFCNMLRRLEFKRDKQIPLIQDLTQFFRQLR